MKVWLLATLAILPWSALAQIQVFQFDGTTETAVGSLCNVGPATPGDTLETRFRVRNIGSGPATFQTLGFTDAAGVHPSQDGFQIAAAPSLPYIIAPGNFAEFR